MTDYIKLDSDRPDYDQTLENLDGTPVDLADATAVHMLMWDDQGDLLVNDTAEILTPAAGEVHYDFARSQIVEPGTNDIEFRVDWADGDRQWFPIDRQAYELEVVDAGGVRDADLEDPDIAPDAEANVLTIFDSIFIDSDDGTLQLDNGDVHITGGDLTVDGGVNIGDFAFGDDQVLAFGANDDFLLYYDSTEDAWNVANGIGGVDVFALSKGGDLALPQGGLAASGDITVDATTVFDATAGNVPASVLSSDTVTVAGNAVALGGSTAVDHADLSNVLADQHHTRYADSEAQDAVGAILSSEFTYDSTVPEIALSNQAFSHDVLTDVSSDDHHARFTDEEAQDAVAAALNNQFTYDDANNVIGVEPGNIFHDDLAGIGGNNHHVPLEIQDGGTTVTDGDYVVDFGTDLTATDNGDGSVTIDSTASGSGSTLDTQEGGASVESDTDTLDFDSGDFAVTNPTTGEAEVAVDTDAIATDELDLSIAPTWTGTHTHSNPLEVTQGGILLEFRESAGDAIIRGNGPNGDLGRFFMRQDTSNDVYMGDVDATGGEVHVRTDGSDVVHYDTNQDAHFQGDVTKAGTQVPDVHEAPNAHIQHSTLPDGDHAAQPVYIPDGQTLEVWLWGARTDVPDTPAGLTVELYDETADVSVSSESTARTTGAPVASLSASGSAVDATLRVDNATGAEVVAGASFGYTVS